MTVEPFVDAGPIGGGIKGVPVTAGVEGGGFGVGADGPAGVNGGTTIAGGRLEPEPDSAAGGGTGEPEAGGGITSPLGAMLGTLGAAGLAGGAATPVLPGVGPFTEGIAGVEGAIGNVGGFWNPACFTS